MGGFHKRFGLPEGLDRDAGGEIFVRRPEAFMAGPDLPVTPDAHRRPFTREEFIAVTAGDREDRSLYFVHDTPAIRFVFLDTVCNAGGAEGCIDEDQVRWLERRLQEVPGRPVVVTSHHTLDTLGNKRRASGSRYIDADELFEVGPGVGNVVFWPNDTLTAN